MAHQPAYVRWQRQHPEFDLKEYTEWVRSRGYYKAALDVSKPDFYEYASVYVQRRLVTIAG